MLKYTEHGSESFKQLLLKIVISVVSDKSATPIIFLKLEGGDRYLSCLPTTGK